MMNLAPLNPEARPIVEQAIEVYLKHLDPWFIGFIVQGDALKGRLFPGCSELQIKLYLEQEAFSENAQLPFELCEFIQRELLSINPIPFRYLNCSVASNLETSTGPVSNAYHLLAGRLPVEEATNKELHEDAEQALLDLIPVPISVANALLEPGGVSLEFQLRNICDRVWGMLYYLLTLLQKDGICVYGLSKKEAIDRLPENSEFQQSIQGFVAALQACPSNRFMPEQTLRAISQGIRFLRAVRAWRDGEMGVRKPG